MRGRKLTKTPQRNDSFSFLDKKQLMRLRTRAARSGVWFKRLPQIDRVLVNLVIKITDHIRSPSLARSLAAITRKLEGLMQGKLERAVREIGLPMARSLSRFAQKWGNTRAKQWANDADFARYLAIMNLSGRAKT